MTTIEKCKLAVEKGYKYNEETGEVIGMKGGVIRSIGSDGYVKIVLYENKKSYELSAHQFAWYFKYNEVAPIIDHINRDKLDNKIVNLRSVTTQQNAFNTNARGYIFDKKRNKYRAYIKVGGKNINLGRFNTASEAEEAYKQAKKIHHII